MISRRLTPTINRGIPRRGNVRASAFLHSFGLALAVCLISAAESSAGWELTFCDDFSTPSLDRSKWKYSDIGSSQTISQNKEKQCYVPSAVQQSNGILKLIATKEAVQAQLCKGAAFDLEYTSGMVTTAGCNVGERQLECKSLKSFSQAFGYFEVRAKLPTGKGLWPAFWLMPIRPGWPPEIDVMEALGHEEFKVYQTYHYRDSTGAHQSVGGSYVGPDFSKEFSTFGVDWQPDRLTWYVNGHQVFQHVGTNISHEPMYILLNLAVGGSMPGDPNETTLFPSAMEIDYVRVYQRKNDGLPVTLPPARAADCMIPR